jgi:hypothetical protein
MSATETNFSAEPVGCSALGRMDTEFCADSVEALGGFLQADGLTDWFLVGNYELVSSQAQLKQGKLYLCEALGEGIGEGENKGDDDGGGIRTHQVVGDIPAVFDVKWNLDSANPTAAVACADGSVLFYGLDTETRRLVVHEGIPSLTPLHQAAVSAPAACLSVCFEQLEAPANVDDGKDKEQQQQQQQRMCVSYSDGSVRQLTRDESGAYQPTTVIPKAHDFEAWIVTMSSADADVLYSGGDDMVLKCWDVKAGARRPVWKNTHHGAGVCVITSHPSDANVLATGSYDEKVCVWDVRNMCEPTWEHESGGGVWRLRWKDDLLLAGCMHNGFHVLDTKKKTVAATFKMHKSLAYGCDWLGAREGEPEGAWRVASCSFYDRLVYTWTSDSA